MKLRCPYCDTRLTVRDEQAGKTSRCSACAERFVVPRLPGGNRRTSRPPADDSDPFLEIVSDDGASESRVEPKSRGGRVRTDVSPGMPNIPQDALRSVRYGIRRYLNEAGDDAFREIDLSISVDQYDPGSQLLRYLFPFFAGAAQVSVSVSGTVNGRAIDEIISAARYIGAFGGSSQSMLDASMQDCIWKLCLAVDNAGGREASSFGRVWAGIRVLSWLLGAFVFVAYAALFVAIHLPDAGGLGGKICVALFVGLLTSAASMGVLAFSGLIVAPRNFLLNDPRGMQVMSRSGVKSPWALRIVAVFLLFFSLAVIAFAIPILLVRR